MNYIKQLITVTRWEFTRFFKPKNEAIGIIVMLITFSITYLAGRYFQSEKSPEIEVYIYNDSDGALTETLKDNFMVHQLSAMQKESFIKELSIERTKVLLDKKEGTIGLYAYKNNRDIKKLRSYIGDYHKQVEMQRMGISNEQLATVFSPAPIEESFILADNSRDRVILTYFFAGLMIMAVFLSFAYQFTAITGEKQLKITEQIVSAIGPQIWMDGKILGITLTGISSMLTYSMVFIIGGVLFFQFTGTPIAGLLEFIYLPSIIIYFLFALMGVLLWNAILAAIASVITDPNNSGKTSLIGLPLVFIIASFIVTGNPDSSVSVFLSWFPLTSATSMPMRWAITEVGIWELIGSFMLLVLTFYFVRKIAAKIFRVSILISGNEPSWIEVYRLMKMK